jgi:enoyl-[acyl-carrier protein] reductase II
MIWNSGYKLASAVSNAGGLRLDWCRFYVSQYCANTFKKKYFKTFCKCRYLYPNIEEIMKIIVDEGVRLFYIGEIQKHGQLT